MTGEEGPRIRADFACRGWSIQHDLGTRLSWGDAVALYECLASDLSTYTGAGAAHMPFRMDATAVIQSMITGATGMLGDLDPDKVRRAARQVTEQERREAEKSMSSIFDM